MTAHTDDHAAAIRASISSLFCAWLTSAPGREALRLNAAHKALTGAPAMPCLEGPLAEKANSRVAMPTKVGHRSMNSARQRLANLLAEDDAWWDYARLEATLADRGRKVSRNAVRTGVHSNVTAGLVERGDRGQFRWIGGDVE